MRMIDLFSGIGGFHYAAEQVWKDVECLVHCEIDSFCQKILKKHWPDVPAEPDIHKLDGAKYADVDLLTGGFPCQPYSVAGQRRGAEDDRALWPQMLRVIQEAKPRWIIAENVSGFLSLNGGVEFEHCLASLEDAGYEVQAFVIAACAVDAPHRRDRVWIVARNTESIHVNSEQKIQGRENIESAKVCKSLANARSAGICERRFTDDVKKQYEQSRRMVSNGIQKRPECKRETLANAPNARAESMRGWQDAAAEIIADRNNQGLQGWEKPGNVSKERARGNQQPERCANSTRGVRSIKPGLGGMVDGVSYWLDEPAIPRVTTGQKNRTARLKALGNAIVPQVAVQIMRAIKAADEH